MMRTNLKKGIIIIGILLIGLLFCNNVYATVNPIDIPTINTETNTTTDTNTTTNVIAPTTNAITNTTTSNYENSTLPQTGDASDYAIFILIAVSIVIAIYAYKKIRDYNI